VDNDERPDMTARPTLAELAQSARSASGWDCPRCGCSDWRVVNSYYVPSSGSRNRTRYCRNCKHVIHTVETTVEELPEPPVNVQAVTNSNDVATMLTPTILASESKHDDAYDRTRSDRAKRSRPAVG